MHLCLFIFFFLSFEFSIRQLLWMVHQPLVESYEPQNIVKSYFICSKFKSQQQIDHIFLAHTTIQPMQIHTGFIHIFFFLSIRHIDTHLRVYYQIVSCYA